MSYVDEQNKRAKLLLGTECSPQDYTDAFTLMAPDRRIEILRAIDTDMDDTDMNLRKRASLVQLRRHLDGLHHSMRKAGR